MINDINWPLLRRQKLSLLEILDKNNALSVTQIDHLNGLLALVDAIQDDAVESDKFTEFQVFGNINTEDE